MTLCARVLTPTMLGVNQKLRVLCVGRHEFISEHLGRYFGGLGFDAETAIGLKDALLSAERIAPEVVLCEYELLATCPLTIWENSELLSRTAIIGVSLSRRPNEVYPLDVNGVTGFLYLPALDRESALRIIHAAAASTHARYTPPLPGTSPSPRTARKLQAN